jgi:hypothetical protein
MPEAEANWQRVLVSPERPGLSQRARPWAWRLVVAFAGICLLLYGLLTMFVASAWGPGNSDELVTGGPELIPWYGLSTCGTLAALVGLAFIPRPRSARWALLLAAISLAGWTAFLFLVVD